MANEVLTGTILILRNNVILNSHPGVRPSRGTRAGVLSPIRVHTLRRDLLRGGRPTNPSESPLVGGTSATGQVGDSRCRTRDTAKPAGSPVVLRQLRTTSRQESFQYPLTGDTDNLAAVLDGAVDLLHCNLQRRASHSGTSRAAAHAASHIPGQATGLYCRLYRALRCAEKPAAGHRKALAVPFRSFHLSADNRALGFNATRENRLRQLCWRCRGNGHRRGFGG